MSLSEWEIREQLENEWVGALKQHLGEEWRYERHCPNEHVFAGNFEKDGVLYLGVEANPPSRTDKSRVAYVKVVAIVTKPLALFEGEHYRFEQCYTTETPVQLAAILIEEVIPDLERHASAARVAMDAKVAECQAFGDEIAAALGPYWSASTRWSGDRHWQSNLQIAFTKGEAMAYFTWLANGKVPERFVIRTERGDLNEFFPYGHETGEITVSSSKTGKRIAGDMMSRLLPVYLTGVQQAIFNRQQQRNRSQAVRAIVDRFLAAAGGKLEVKDNHERRDEFRSSFDLETPRPEEMDFDAWYERTPRAEVEVRDYAEDKTHVEMKLRLTPSDAEKVLALLATL